jgi:outer membrane receptor protein involved in Fe transport
VSASFENYARTRALGANQNDLNVQDDDRRIGTGRVVDHLLIGTRAALSLGGEFRRDSGDAVNRRWIGTTVPSANYTFDQDLDLRTYGIFAQAQAKVVNALKLVGGIRTDWFDYDIVNRKLPAASISYTDGIVTPRGGIVWTPIKSADVFANIGQGLRSPNQSEISPSGSVGPLGAGGGTPYPDLHPPKVVSYDVGLSTPIGSRLRLSAARYHTLNDHEIVQVAAGVFATVGNTTRDGWELEADAQASSTLRLYGSYAGTTRAQINNPPPNTASVLSIPRHAVTGGAAYTTAWLSHRLLLNGDWRDWSVTSSSSS